MQWCLATIPDCSGVTPGNSAQGPYMMVQILTRFTIFKAVTYHLYYPIGPQRMFKCLYKK